jgi:hypothetical protein
LKLPHRSSTSSRRDRGPDTDTDVSIIIYCFVS